jgi:hypothetical protein
MAELDATISEAAWKTRESIPKSNDFTSPESRQRYALEVTGIFFDPKERKRYGNLWLGDTFDNVGKAVQKVTGQLRENPELKAPVHDFITTGLHSHIDGVLRAWEIPSVPKVALAEVKSANGFIQLGWFSIG